MLRAVNVFVGEIDFVLLCFLLKIRRQGDILIYHCSYLYLSIFLLSHRKMEYTQSVMHISCLFIIGCFSFDMQCHPEHGPLRRLSLPLDCGNIIVVLILCDKIRGKLQLFDPFHICMCDEKKN